MPTGVGTKYHVALAPLSATNTVGSFLGYLLRGNSYMKSDAKLFTPRFGTGQAGETDLDIWKTWTQDDFSGGSFQDIGADPSKTSMMYGFMVNKYNNRIYPKPNQMAIVSGSVTNAINMQCYGRLPSQPTKIYFGAASGSVGASFGSVVVYDFNTNTFTNVKTDFASQITGMTSFNGKLYVCGYSGTGTSTGIWSYDGTTWTQITLSWGGNLLTVYNGILYGNGYAQANNSGTLYYWNLQTNTGNLIGNAGDATVPINSFVVYNHRLYMAKNDGLYVYDGVQISTILDSTSSSFNIVADGYGRCMEVFNGSLYYVSNNVLYRYNGSTIEVVQRFDAFELVLAINTANDRLWITTNSAIADGGKGGASGQLQAYYYDGFGFFKYFAPYTYAGSAYAFGVFYSQPNKTYLWITMNYTSSGISVGYVTSQVDFMAASNTVAELYTTQFDGDFPNVYKLGNSVTVQLNDLVAGDQCIVYARTFDGVSWSSYNQIGTITSSTSNKLMFSDAVSPVPAWKKIQLKITHKATGTPVSSIKSFSMEYILQPDYRRQWQFTLLTQGSSNVPMILADNTTVESNSPKVLRDGIYAARKSYYPALYQDIDTTVTAATLTNVATTVTVGSTASFPDTGYIQIEDEIIAYTGRTATTFTGLTRGKFGTTAVAHNTIGTIVQSIFKVILTSINFERNVAPAIVDGVMDVAGNETEISVTLQEAN